jgi:hypothetical protein
MGNPDKIIKIPLCNYAILGGIGLKMVNAGIPDPVTQKIKVHVSKQGQS